MQVFSHAKTDKYARQITRLLSISGLKNEIVNKNQKCP